MVRAGVSRVSAYHRVCNSVCIQCQNNPLRRELWLWVLVGDRWLIWQIIEVSLKQCVSHIFRYGHMLHWRENKFITGKRLEQKCIDIPVLTRCCVHTFALTPHESSPASESLHLPSRQSVLPSHTNHTHFKYVRTWYNPVIGLFRE